MWLFDIQAAFGDAAMLDHMLGGFRFVIIRIEILRNRWFHSVNRGEGIVGCSDDSFLVI
jgi:hypothetical protein